MSNAILEQYASTSDTQEQRLIRRNIRFRKDDPRVAFVSPQVIGAKNQLRKCTPPLGIASLAAVLEARGFRNILAVDAAADDYNNVRALPNSPNFIIYGLPDEGVVDKLRKFQPDVVAISALFSSQVECAYNVAYAIREAFPDVLIVMGGNHASYRAVEILKTQEAIDFVLCGEADLTFAEFLEKYFSGQDFRDVAGLVQREGSNIIQNSLPALIHDLDVLPDPAYHLFDMERYFEIDMFHNPFTKSGRVGVIMTSRGCPQECYFCTSFEFHGRAFRRFSSARTVRLVHHLVEEYRIEELQILDDTLTSLWARVVEICEGIKPLNLRVTLPNSIRADLPKNRENRLKMFKAMRAAGVEQFGIGVEHGDQDFLDKVIHKRLELDEVRATIDMAHEAEILVHSAFIMGFPHETAKNREKTIEFAKSLDSDSFSVSFASPLPGTPMWNIVEQDNLFVPGFDLGRVVFTLPSIIPADISPDELYALIERLNRELNEQAQRKRPEAAKAKLKMFKEKNKTASGDRKFQFAPEIESLNYVPLPHLEKEYG